jgi:probable addiction module antidote protein
MKTKSYRDWLGAKLSDPERAARYLNAASEDSEAMFLKALRKVATAQQRPMTQIAELCNVSRESLYRMLSETGNPTSDNRRAILAALGLKSIVVPIEKGVGVSGNLSDGSRSIVRGTLKGNSLSGGRRQESSIFFGAATIPHDVTVQRKLPVLALELKNSSLVGGQQDLALQTGGGH